MKRLLLLFTVFLGAFAMAGCDMFSPEVVEEISEQYCRDNPEADICQGESVGDLQEDAVINVFNTILAEYADTTNTTFCDDYFSVTNIPLLDECRASRSELIPEDLEGWTIEGVTKQPSLSTQDIYELVIVSPDGLTSYTFEIGLTYVEGIMYINFWDYEVETTDPTTLTVTLEDATALFQQFLNDYTNPAIDSATICATYNIDDDITQCQGDREENLANNLTFEYISLVADGSQFIGSANWDDDMYGSGTVAYTLDVFYDTSAVLQLHVIEQYAEMVFTEADFLAFLNDLFDDFFRSDRTAEDVCNEYFVDDQYDVCMDGYEQKEEGGYTQEVVSLEPYEDHYLVTVNMLVDGISQGTIQFEAWFHNIMGELKIQIDPDSGEPSEYDIYRAFLVELVEDYDNPTIDSAVFCDTYFETEDTAACAAERDDFLASGATLTFIDLKFDDALQEWSFDLEINDGTDVTVETQVVVFVYNEDDELRALWDSEPQDPLYDTYYQLLSDFIADYQDSALDSYTVCAQYLIDDDPQGCADERDEFINEPNSVELLDLYIDDNDQWIFVVRFDEGGNIYDEHVKVDFVYDNNNDLKLKMGDDGDMYQVYYDFVQDFIADYQDGSIDSMWVCTTYLDNEDFDQCAADRDQFLADGITATLMEFYQLDDFTWEFKLELNDGTNVDTIVQPIEFIYDIDGNLKIVMRDGDGEYDQYYQFLLQFMEDYQNSALDSTTVCDTFLLEGATSECVDERDLFISNGGTATLLDLYRDEFGYWVFEAEIYDGTSSETITQAVEFVWDNTGNLKLKWADVDPNIDIYKQLVLDLIAEFQDSSIPSADVCGKFFDPEDQDGCIDERDNNYDFSYAITLGGFWPHGDGSYGVELIYNNGTDEYSKRMIATFFQDMNNNWKMKFEQDPMMFFRDYMEQYIADLQDPSITDDDFCNMYFEGDIVAECLAGRSTGIANFTYMLLDLHPLMDGVWYYSMQVDAISSNEQFVQEDYILFYEDEFGNIKIHFLVDQAEFNDYRQFFTDFISQYDDASIPSIDVCNLFFSGDEALDCIDKRDNHDFNYIMELVEFYPLPSGQYKAVIRHFYFDPAAPDEWHEEVYVEFYYDASDNLKISITGDPYHGGDEDFRNHVEQFTETFRQAGWTIDSICATYFDPANQQPCIDRFTAYVGGTYNVTLISFFPIMDGMFHVYIEFEQNNELYPEEFDVKFFYDEFNSLWMTFASMGPRIDFDTAQAYIDNFVSLFNDPFTTNDDFATQLLHPNSHWIAYEWRQSSIDNGLTITHWWLTEMYGNYTFEFEMTDGTRHYFEVLFHDESGTLLAELWYPEDGIYYDDAWDWAGQLFSTIASGAGTEDICATFFGGPSYQRCTEDISAWLLSGVTVTPFMLYDEFDKWDLELELQYPDGHYEYEHWYLTFFWDESNALRGEFVDEHHDDPVTWNDAEAFLAQIVQGLNNGDNIDDICNALFYIEDSFACAAALQYIRDTGATIINVHANDMGDHWEFEFELEYTDLSVEWYYLYVTLHFQADRTVRAHIFEAGDGIPMADKEAHLYNFQTDFNDGSLDATTFCQMYVGVDTQDNCVALYTDVHADGYDLYWWFYDFHYEPNYLEFATYANSDSIAYYISYEVKFFYDENDQLKFDLLYPFSYTYGDQADVQIALNDLIGDFNDMTISDDDFCNSWGNLFMDCYGTRQMARTSGDSLQLIGLYDQGDHMFSAHVERVDSTGGVVETMFFHLAIVIDLEGYVNIWGWQEGDIEPMYDIATVTQAFTSFLTDYFDTSLTLDDLFDMYPGTWIPGMRQMLLDDGVTVVVSDVYLINAGSGYEEYEALLTVTDPSGTSSTVTVRFDIYEDWNNNLVPNIYFDHDFPTPPEIDTFLAAFLNAVNNMTIADAEICADFFGPWDSWLCNRLRETLRNESLTLSLIEVHYDEWNTTVEMALSNGLTILLGVDENYDILGNQYLVIYYEIPLDLHDDAQADLESLIDGWIGSGMTLDELCLDIPCNGILAGTQVIDDISINEFYFRPGVYLQPMFSAELTVWFTDSTWQTVYLGQYVTTNMTEPIYTFTYQVLGEELPFPFGYPGLGIIEAQDVIDAFIVDLLDPTIDAQTLCDTYFGTQMRSIDCVEARQMYIDGGYTITVDSWTTGTVDFLASTIHVVTFTFDDGTTTMDMTTGLHIVQLDDTHYFILFIDEYTPAT